MSAYAPFAIHYSPVDSYPGTTQQSWTGAQTVAGRRGTLPTFTGNSYFIAKSGSDSNSGLTSAAPFLTFNQIFGTPSASSPLADASGNGNSLTATGSPPAYAYPFFSPTAYPSSVSQPIVPPTTSSFAGPFTGSNFYNLPSAVYTGMNGKTAITIDGWFYAVDFPSGTYNLAGTCIGASNTWIVYLDSSGKLNFKIGSTAILSSALTIGQWYYFAAVYDGSHLNLYIGPTPETAAVAATPVAYSTATGNSTTGGIGATINGGDFNGYLCRVSFSNVARTSFPTLVGSSGALGTYEFSTPPLAVTATKSYVVVLDSGTYNEAIYFNYRYDLTAALGIYSVDGQAPTITYAKGALAGTYGVGNSAQPALSAPNYYVSKSGSDSTGTGSSGNPWLTITHSIASMSSAQILQVMDSGVYQEDLVIPAGWAITIQAASGQAPTLRNVNQSASGVHLSSGSNSYETFVTVIGCILDGQGSLGALCGSVTSNSWTFLDCSVTNYQSLTANTQMIFTAVRTGFTLCNSGGPASSAFWNLFQFTGCYYSTMPSGTGAQQTINFGGYFVGSSNTTWVNCVIAWIGDSLGNMGNWRGNFLNNSSILLYSSSYLNYFNFCDNLIYKGNLLFASPGAATGSIGIFYNNNLQMGYTGQPGFGFSETGSGTIHTYGTIQNCVAMGNSNNFYWKLNTASSGNFCNINQNTSIGASAAGFYQDQIFGSDADSLTACVDSGSASAVGGAFVAQPGIFTPYVDANAAVVSNSRGNENIALLPSDPGVFTGSAPQLDYGYDWAIWMFNIGAALTVNGLIFASTPYPSLVGSTTANQESGIFCNSLSPLLVKFCSFLGLGPYGLNLPAQSTAMNNYFNVNGNAIKMSGHGHNIYQNVGWECGGAFVVNAGQNSQIMANSSYGCAYGQYDMALAVLSVSLGNVFAGSSAYDYSGNGVLSYSCIGTIDPATFGSVDQFSTRLDPLFCDTLTGDLRLQTLATGYYFDSPCKGSGPGGADMGAFAMTYGTLSRVWTTIDFSLTDNVGPATGPYRNPDVAGRKVKAIHLSEGDLENGVPYSVASTYKWELSLTWREDANPMPTAQLLALMEMFESGSNQIEISLGGMPLVPPNFVPAYIVRSSGFEFADVIGGLADTSVPTPVKEIIVRLT